MPNPDAVVLAIDPGEKSPTGAALWCADDSHPRFVSRWECTEAYDRELAIGRACGLAKHAGVPLVFVAESWTAHGNWGAKAMAGTERAVGRWLERLEMEHACYAMVRVEVNVWRKAVLGRTRMSKAEAKQAALRRAGAKWEYTGDSDHVAEALCILEWALLAPEVHRAARKAGRRLTKGKVAV